MSRRKSSKRFIISTDTENNAGFHVRTEGIETAAYLKNPILLWMHQRAKGKSRDEILPMGNLEDIEIGQKQISGVPAFDEDDWFAMTIFKKVDSGTIRMASIGLKPIEWKQEGEKLWLWRSQWVETSLCDIGSNPEALAVKLYDENDEIITLSDEYLETITATKTPITDMKLIQLSPEVLPLLKLADGATPEQIQAKIQELVTLADSQKAKLETLTTEKADAVTLKEKAEADLAKLKEDTAKAELVALVDKAVEDRKITADQKEDFLILSYDAAKSILGKMTGTPTVQAQLSAEHKNVNEEWVKLSYDELEEKELVPRVMKEAPELFQKKYKEKFGTEYKGGAK